MSMLGNIREEMSQNTYESIVTIWFDTNQMRLIGNKVREIVVNATHWAVEKSLRLLGVYVDNNLRWESHCEKLCIKLSAAVFSIRKMKTISTYQCTWLTYFANIHSLVSYGDILCGAFSAANSAFLLQKIYILAYLQHIHSHKEVLKINTFKHTYNTRHAQDRITPRHRLRKSRQDVEYWWIKLYYLIAVNIRAVPCKVFQNIIWRILLDSTVYSIGEFIGGCTAS